MTDIDIASDIKTQIMATVGKWAVTILATIALSGFAVGAWATKQDSRTANLETGDQARDARIERAEVEWRTWRDSVNSKLDRTDSKLDELLKRP